LLREPTRAPRPHDWKGPYLDNIPNIPRDPWGREYLYRAEPGVDRGGIVTSYGMDGLPGGHGLDADVTSEDTR
jgi:general secretion pathway protein G